MLFSGAKTGRIDSRFFFGLSATTAAPHQDAPASRQHLDRRPAGDREAQGNLRTLLGSTVLKGGCHFPIMPFLFFFFF